MTVGEQLTNLQNSFDAFKVSFDTWKEAQGLRCEEHRVEIWKAINKNRVRLAVVAVASFGAGGGITAAILEALKQ